MKSLILPHRSIFLNQPVVALTTVLTLASLFFAITLLTHKSALAQTAPSGQYTGCLKTSGSTGGFFGQFYNFDENTAPLLPCGTGDVEVSLSSPTPKTLAKEAVGGAGGSTSTTTSSSPVSLSNTAVSFSASEITVPSKLIINWVGRFNNSSAGLGYGLQSHVIVDSNIVVTTHLNEPLAGGWFQAAANRVIEVDAGAHTVEAKWNIFGGGTGTSGDTQMVVTVIPQ